MMAVEDARSSATDEITIAGALTAKDWWAFRENLKAGDPSCPWELAYTTYFLPRLELRYLGPIDRIRRGQAYSGEGFAITSLLCAVIEFLAANHFGETYRRKKPGANEYSSSSDLFQKFLTGVAPFQNDFDEASAAAFFDHIRCGLLHEAATRGGWKIHVGGPRTINLQTKVLYRDKLTDKVLSYVEAYKGSLCRDSDIQAAFLRKFDNLASDAA